MYTEHPAFNPPPDDAVLWRYMDFTKFVSLLDRSALFFARADKLGDPFEGAVSVKNKELRVRSYVEGLSDFETLLLQVQFPGKDMHEISEDRAHDWMKFLKRQRQFTLISCWHESIHESAAMWRLYARATDGIAIRTDFSSLKQSLISSEDIFIGKVNYVDYEHHQIPEHNLFYPYLHKRQDFKHEEEVRAITTTYPKSVEEVHQPPDICDVGRHYEVDLSFLIKAVVVAPYADDWFLELVQSVVVNRYKLELPVVRSNLAQKPIWDREQAEE